jgi:mandelate racemase
VTLHDLKIRSIQTTLVKVPMRRALGTSAMRIDHAPLLLVDLQTEEGIVGHAYLFCYLQSAGIAAQALFQDAAAVLADKAVAPTEVRRLLEGRFRLIGARGLVSMVMAGIDIACWDALAKAAALPLATLLGAALRPVPAYNSNGLGLLDPQAAADEALELVAEGFSAIKMRLGRPRGADDLAAVRAVRKAIPAAVHLMADFNQALSPAAHASAAIKSMTKGFTGSKSRFATTTTPAALNLQPACARRCRSARTSPGHVQWRRPCPHAHPTS